VNPIRERIGVLCWRIFGRCFVCDRRVLLHTRRQWHECNNTPLPIAAIRTEEGWLLAMEPVVPVSHAQPA
jgi:hypothetical protein